MCSVFFRVSANASLTTAVLPQRDATDKLNRGAFAGFNKTTELGPLLLPTNPEFPLVLRRQAISTLCSILAGAPRVPRGRYRGTVVRICRSGASRISASIATTSAILLRGALRLCRQRYAK
jgi:hypothetical protein